MEGAWGIRGDMLDRGSRVHKRMRDEAALLICIFPDPKKYFLGRQKLFKKC